MAADVKMSALSPSLISSSSRHQQTALAGSDVLTPARKLELEQRTVQLEDELRAAKRKLSQMESRASALEADLLQDRRQKELERREAALAAAEARLLEQQQDLEYARCAPAPESTVFLDFAGSEKSSCSTTAHCAKRS